MERAGWNRPVFFSPFSSALSTHDRTSYLLPQVVQSKAKLHFTFLGDRVSLFLPSPKTARVNTYHDLAKNVFFFLAVIH